MKAVPWRHGRRLGAVVMAFATLVAMAAPAARAQIAPIELDDAAAGLERVDRLMDVIEEMRAALDRTRFEYEALALELAFEDPEGMEAWVQEAIAFEAYAGLLRGPQGTLMARAGNALDGAVLLAKLLNDAGFEARVARTTLGADAARRLLTHAGTAPRATAPVADEAALRAALSRLDDVLDVEEEALLTQLEATLERPPVAHEGRLAEVEDLSRVLTTEVRAGDVAFGDGAEAALLEEARDYFWVQWRLHDADPWRDAHPVAWNVPAELEAESVLEGGVPEELQHRLRIEVTLEQKRGDDLHTEPVMDPWERPVANLVGHTLSYANAPNGFQLGPVGAYDLESVVEDTTMFAPYFGGDLAPGGQMFDLDGRTVPPEVAGDQAAGVFQSVAGATEQAAGALGALGDEGADEDPDELMALTGLWIDYVLVAPGGEETRHRRTMLDRVGPENRAAGRARVREDAPDARLALLRQQRIMVSPGRVPAGYVLDRTLERILETRRYLEAVVSQVIDPREDFSIDADVLGGPSPVDHLLAFDVFERALGDASDAVGYRHAPALVVLGESLAGTVDDAVLQRSIDVVANPRRVPGAEPGTLDAAAALRRGVWETVAEREITRESAIEEDAPSARVDATAATRAAREAGRPLRVVRAGDVNAVDALGLPPQAARNLRADLENGYAAIVAAAPESLEETAWWRIDPSSGATLGVSFDGRGQSLTEYTIQLYDNAFTVMFAVKGLTDCMDKGGIEEACCLLEAHLSNVAGLGLGGVVGGAFGAGAGLAFTLGTGMAGTDFSDPMGLTCEEITP